jgi:hypothetical protein
LTYHIIGFVNGEKLATSGVTGQAILTTTATPSSPPGRYRIKLRRGTLAALNYVFKVVSGTLTVAGRGWMFLGSQWQIFGRPVPRSSPVGRDR